jgi:MFS family permease
VIEPARARGSSELRAHWPIVLGSFLGVTFGLASLFGYTVGIFMKPLQAEFGWSRSQISIGLLFSTLTFAITAPLVGFIADRVNLRKIVIFSTLALALGFVALASLWNALWLFMLLMAGKAFLSAGTSPVVYTRVINQWFNESRGLALGLALAGNGVAAAFLPRILAPYVAEHGWRAGYLVLATVVLISAPLICLLVRDRRFVSTAPASSDPAPGGGLAAPEAVRSRTFWLLIATLLMPAIGLGGIAIHLVPMLTDAGSSPARAGAIAGILGLAVIIGRVLTGFLLDRWFAPRVAAMVFAVSASGCLGLAGFESGFAPYGIFLVGIAIGAEVDIIGYLIARYFGMRSYGVLYGLMYTTFMLGTSLSQLIASILFDSTGSYRVFLLTAAASLAIGSLLSLCLPRFDERGGEYAQTVIDSN